MSGVPRERSVNLADLETGAVLGPIGNKAGLPSTLKPGSKPLQKPESFPGAVKSPGEVKSPEGKKKVNQLSSVTAKASSELLRHEKLLQSNLSLNASCSSDASTESCRSRASTGRLMRSSSPATRRKPSFCNFRWRLGFTSVVEPCPEEKMSLGYPNYRKLFELLVLSGALAELTWPSILSQRHTSREAFTDVDPLAVSKLSAKKMALPGSPASALLSEPKLRTIIENACLVTKVVEEFGSFDKYIWSFCEQQANN